MSIKDKIVQDISDNYVMLYMKGTKDMPMCGFSSTIVKILDHYGVPYKATNVLEDPNIRVELSKHSNWPTIPQLFVDGQLIGGCDIALEMHNEGTLKDVFNKND
jgi:monothiol glutaredoxin|tara:strand:+ start:3461 stop:3772 length:312 start_codon:yes stop_codon:yes gene_type:complete